MGYECASYQGFLQQTVRLCGLGYFRYRLTEYPASKLDRWPGIDQKLCAKYPILGLSKYQRAYRKAQGLLNAQLLRFRALALILMTDGQDDIGILAAEKPHDVRRSPIRLPIDDLEFQIHRRDGRFTVSLTWDCFAGLKAYYIEAAKKGEVKALAREFGLLDQRLPSWHGLYLQKTQLRDLILRSARQAGRKWLATDFPVSRLKRTAKVFL